MLGGTSFVGTYVSPPVPLGNDEDSPTTPPRSSHRVSSSERRLLYTALHQAVLDCRFHQVRLLVEKCRANVDSKDLFGRTPLMLCALLEEEHFGLRMMKILLRSESINFGLKDHLGRTALIYACLHGRDNLVEALLKADLADIAEPDNDGNTALHHAVVHGGPKMVKALVESHKVFGSSLDPRNSLGYTPLILACKYRNCHAAAIILTKSPGSANLRENQTYMNALEWLRESDRLFRKARKRQRQNCFDPDAPSPPPSPIPARPRVRMNATAQMRPTFLTERTASSLTNFYKEITSPILRDIRTSADFHGTVGLPHLPSSASKFIGITVPSRAEVQIPVRSTTSQLECETPPPPDFLSMGEDAVRDWLWQRLEENERVKPDGSLSAPSSRSRNVTIQPRIPLSRPMTHELRRVAPPSRMTSCDNLRFIFRIYCDSLNAPACAEVFDPMARLYDEGSAPSTLKRGSLGGKVVVKPKGK